MYILVGAVTILNEIDFLIFSNQFIDVLEHFIIFVFYVYVIRSFIWFSIYLLYKPEPWRLICPHNKPSSFGYLPDHVFVSALRVGVCNGGVLDKVCAKDPQSHKFIVQACKQTAYSRNFDRTVPP
jgi:hypothetical protein